MNLYHAKALIEFVAHIEKLRSAWYESRNLSPEIDSTDFNKLSTEDLIRQWYIHRDPPEKKVLA